MDTRTRQISPKNYSNEQTKKWSKFIRNIDFKEIIKFLLGSGFMFSLIGLIVNCIAEKAQKQMIMTDYIKNMSTLILTEDIYRTEVGLDDLNKEQTNKIFDKQSVLNKDFNESEIINIDKNAQKKHEAKRLIARAFTLSTLRRFEDDGNLKGQVIQFLYESNLIGFCEQKDEISDSKVQCSEPSEPIIKLGDAKLDKANVRDVIPLLNGLDLKNSNLKGANFSQTSLLSANFNSARLNNADFSVSFLDRAKFESAILNNANFKSAILNNANFKYARLNNADFSNKADFLSGSILNKANFEDACLLGTNFSKAQGINEAKFKGAFYDQETTKFPPEFKIENSMMIKWTPAMTYCK